MNFWEIGEFTNLASTTKQILAGENRKVKL